MKTDWTMWSAIADLTGTIAIVVTLGYLSIQIKQNTEAQYSQSRQAILISAQAELFESMRNPDLSLSVVKPGALTREENSRLSDYLTAVMRVREFSWLQFKNGIIDRDQWKTESGVIGIVLSTKRTRKWWEDFGREQFNTEFGDFVEHLLAGIPVSDEAWERSLNWSNL